MDDWEAAAVRFKANPSQLLGMRFTTDFVVVAIEPGPQVVLARNGEYYRIGLDELLTTVERGFVTATRLAGD